LFNVVKIILLKFKVFTLELFVLRRKKKLEKLLGMTIHFEDKNDFFKKSFLSSNLKQILKIIKVFFCLKKSKTNGLMLTHYATSSKEI